MTASKIDTAARRAVLVEWVDSCSPRGWTTFSAMDGYKPDTVTSIGFVLEDAEEHLTLAPHWAKDCIDGVLCIPKCSITKRATIRLPKLHHILGGGAE